MNIMGRAEETEILNELYKSNRPEFLTLYGRRRIGKTFLIRQFFKPKKAIFFNVTGAKDGSMAEQIAHFAKQIGNVFYGGAKLKPGKNWDESLEILTEAINNAPQKQKIILFFDELPWMATKNSRLLQNLDYYWNQYWSNDKRLKLIICGSSASWIINKIIKSKGGLHNRITKQICLEPFNLNDTKNFLKSLGVKLNNAQIAMIYMVTGGIPYYLSYVKKGLSAAQVIEQLAFSKKSILLEEFDNLFASLFNDHESYIEIARILAKRRYGMGKRELLNTLGKSFVGEGGIKKLQALEDTGFIMSFKPHFHKRQGIYYKLIDEYTLFYFNWIEPVRATLQKKSLEKGNWPAIQNSSEWHAWSGYAFESICYKHIGQIRKTLSISSAAIANAWRYIPRKGTKEKGAQIDLLFDRKDNVITICEIKYTDKPFKIDKQYADELLTKVDIFKKRTHTNKQIFISMISANGLKPTMYSEELIASVVTLNDLFKNLT
jgi:AAA+ ATPase superfamily predicted ATPase